MMVTGNATMTQTLTGVSLPIKLTPEQFGTGKIGGDPCPPYKDARDLFDPNDAGDSVGTRRSTARASEWAEEHKAAGVVNWNMGYNGMRHCEFCTEESKADHECLLQLFSGKELPAVCDALFTPPKPPQEPRAIDEETNVAAMRP